MLVLWKPDSSKMTSVWLWVWYYYAKKVVLFLYLVGVGSKFQFYKCKTLCTLWDWRISIHRFATCCQNCNRFCGSTNESQMSRHIGYCKMSSGKKWNCLINVGLCKNSIVKPKMQDQLKHIQMICEKLFCQVQIWTTSYKYRYPNTNKLLTFVEPQHFKHAGFWRSKF